MTNRRCSETEVLIGNDLGICESFPGLSIPVQISVNNDTGDRLNSQNYYLRGGSLRGNTGASAPSQTGDARTNMEQLSIAIYRPGGDADQTRYYNSNLNNNNIPANSTLTSPNANFVKPDQWLDYSSSIPSTQDAPAVIANAPLVSIGELGHIFEPVRAKNAAASNDIKYSRGGGKTFKIGQPDRFDSTTNPAGLWDGNSESASRNWTAWRLVDIFSANSTLQLDGRVNINGAIRDGGAAIKAALHGYNFQPVPESDPQIASSSLSDAAIQELLRQIRARLTNDGTDFPQFGDTSGPFVERGELSEMPIFHTGTDLTNKNIATVYDRGREELFRRLVELTTTRGNIFTVYAVGQSVISKPSAPPVVTSTTRLRVTFRLDPIWGAGIPSDPFDPTTLTRFSKPEKYAIKILYAGD